MKKIMEKIHLRSLMKTSAYSRPAQFKPVSFQGQPRPLTRRPAEPLYTGTSMVVK